MAKKFFLTVLIFCFCIHPVKAVCKKPSLEKEKITSGMTLYRGSYKSPAGRNLNRAVKPDKVPVEGTKKLLVILIKAPEQSSSYNSTDFQDLLFSGGTRTPGSMRDYFKEVSVNKLDVQGDTRGWYSASQSYSYYTEGRSGLGDYPRNSAKLAEEAIDAAESAGVDFSKFDNNGDGVVEGVIIVHQGPGAESVVSSEGDYLWSIKWDLVSGGGSRRYYDGVYINEFIMTPETNEKDALSEIGVFCHEFGHLLGLPELYDTDYSSSGAGVFDLMAAGAWGGDGEHPESPTHLSAWSKSYLGWASVYDDSMDIGGKNLSQVEGTNEIIKLKVDGSSREYFLLCNRQKTGFDKYLPGSGLLIWHVDENRIDSNLPFGALNDDESAQSVALMEADGRFDLRKGAGAGKRGDSGDFFPGSTNNTFFNALSNPSSNKNNGEKSGVSIVNIPPSAVSMTFNLGSSAVPVASISEIFAYPNPFRLKDSSQMIIKYPDNLPANLKIYNIAGELVRSLDSEGTELNNARGEAYWDGKNDEGQFVASGLYIYALQSPMGKKTGKILFVK